jgi:hypothetical protein
LPQPPPQCRPVRSACSFIPPLRRLKNADWLERNEESAALRWSRITLEISARKEDGFDIFNL